MDRPMSAPVKLVGYVALLIIAFLVSYAIAGAVVPRSVVDDWNREAEGQGVHAMTGSPSTSVATPDEEH